MTQSSSASEGKELNKAFLPPNSLLPQVTHGPLGTSLQCHACIWILPLALGEDLRGGKQQIQPATAPTSRRQGEPRSGCTDRLLQLCQPGQVTAVPGSFAQRRPSPPPAGTPRAGSPGRVAPRLPAPGASPAASSPPIPRLPPPRPSASLPSRLPPRRGCSIEGSPDSLPVPPAPSGLPKALRSSEPGAGGSRPPTGDARASPVPERGHCGAGGAALPGTGRWLGPRCWRATGAVPGLSSRPGRPGSGHTRQKNAAGPGRRGRAAGLVRTGGAPGGGTPGSRRLWGTKPTRCRAAGAGGRGSRSPLGGRPLPRSCSAPGARSGRRCRGVPDGEPGGIRAWWGAELCPQRSGGTGGIWERFRGGFALPGPQLGEGLGDTARSGVRAPRGLPSVARDGPGQRTGIAATSSGVKVHPAVGHPSAGSPAERRAAWSLR